jgi:hypothetical protein
MYMGAGREMTQRRNQESSREWERGTKKGGQSSLWLEWSQMLEGSPNPTLKT